MEHVLPRAIWGPQSTRRWRTSWGSRILAGVSRWIVERLWNPFAGVAQLADAFGESVGESMRETALEAHTLARDADSPD